MSAGWEAGLLVALGGALGGALRHLVGVWSARSLRVPAHWGTWMVNCSGAALLGLVLGLSADGRGPTNFWWLLLGVGVLGSYTTVSTFALQVLGLVQAGHRRAAVVYLLATLAGGIALLLLAFQLASR